MSTSMRREASPWPTCAQSGNRHIQAGARSGSQEVVVIQRVLRFVASALLVATAVAPAAAAPITFAFEAEVRSIIDFHNIIPGGTIKAGDIFAGRYTFESTTPDKNPLADTGLYVGDASPSGIRFDLGGFVFQSGDALPLTPLDLSLFTQGVGFNIRGQYDITLPDHWFTVNARLIGLKEVPTDPIPAPEPGTAVLLLSGLALIARRRQGYMRGMRWE